MAQGLCWVRGEAGTRASCQGLQACHHGAPDGLPQSTLHSGWASPRPPRRGRTHPQTHGAGAFQGMVLFSWHVEARPAYLVWPHQRRAHGGVLGAEQGLRGVGPGMGTGAGGCSAASWGRLRRPTPSRREVLAHAARLAPWLRTRPHAGVRAARKGQGRPEAEPLGHKWTLKAALRAAASVSCSPPPGLGIPPGSTHGPSPGASVMGARPRPGPTCSAGLVPDPALRFAQHRSLRASQHTGAGVTRGRAWGRCTKVSGSPAGTPVGMRAATPGAQGAPAAPGRRR